MIKTVKTLRLIVELLAISVLLIGDRLMDLEYSIEKRKDRKK
jgi:hypothetical protein